MDTWVAPLSIMARFARSKSKSADLLCLPVTVPNSDQPLASASFADSSPSRGPAPTRVTYDLKTMITLSTRVGPMPISAHIPEAVTSFDVTNGYVPCHSERKVP